MSDKPESRTDSPPPSSPRFADTWATIKKHKLAEWCIAYVAFGYAALHGVVMLRETFDWPAVVPRLTVSLLVLGLPVVVTLAWYHGHRARQRISGPELLIVSLLLVTAGSALWGLNRPHEQPTAVTSISQPTQAAAVVEKSIAVLPLANESGEASQQYFSDGISEDLITALSQFPGLKVIGRTSAFLFRDSKEDSHNIGAKLGVAHLLEGSVQRSGDVVRVRAELIDTTDGSTQWSERYDRPYKDLFALQDEITRAVAGALRAKLFAGERGASQSDRPPGGSLEAYDALLQGSYYVLRRTEPDERSAIEHYKHAIALDSRYALAWSGLSRAWTLLGFDFLEGPPMQMAFANAREAADRALELAPELAAAHLARGDGLLTADLDWQGAEAEFRRAVEQAPGDGEAKILLGRQLAALGQLQPAIDLTHQALTTDPLRADWYIWLSYYLSALNRLDDAEGANRRAIELQPNAAVYHQRLAVIEILRGNGKAALAAAQQEPPGVWRDIALALASQIGSDRSAADAALKLLIEKHGIGFAYHVAETYALRNDAKATFDWLERAFGNRDPGISLLLYDPLILRFKHDPRFAAYCRKVGLPVPGG